jgi:hypothetical protein
MIPADTGHFPDKQQADQCRLGCKHRTFAWICIFFRSVILAVKGLGKKGGDLF